MTTTPIVLGPNQPPARPYRGGAGIRALRGRGSDDPFAPEDFVASTTCTFGSDVVGLTTLPNGVLLRDAIEADPDAWLGADHVARFGADTGLLVKILHTGERLFNHVHPGADFARRHLGAPHGKTESWLIVDTGGRDAGDVWLGFARDVTVAELEAWFERQDSGEMLEALNHIRVRAGDYVHVPAGTPHSIGEGITMVELQEPVDLSVILEYAPFPALDREAALLGLPVETALAAASTGRTTPSQLRELHGRAADGAFLPAEAQRFYRAERVRGGDVLDAGFSVVVVLDGAGSIGGVDVARGSTVVVPFAAGELTVGGDVGAVRCRPPVA
ncbi:hypothetical protein [Microbacterium halophytorum]|uniref:hypothetical protein n=1 Tax=Microbacterium halophytorum TaxID=2067568 RepID=UPI000CFC843C|nr:hypothetical protein [Microbacterium halophytorum]